MWPLTWLWRNVAPGRKSLPRIPTTSLVPPRLEFLEDRTVPYALTGNAWSRRDLITLSFPADGTFLLQGSSGPIVSNLVGQFNARFGSSAAWQKQVLRAAQQFAAQTNINFSVINDSGVATGSGSYQQGDPLQGDLRIGGYNFGSSSLGTAMLPPQANNYSIAGDIWLNTGQTFNIGSTYDLFTVMMHEVGHALGLGHSTSSSAVLFPSYQGMRSGLSSDDIMGIRAIYSSGQPRAADRYDLGTGNGSFASATNLTTLLNPSTRAALVTSLDLTTTADKDFYRVTAPSGTTGTLVVRVQSSGLSLLSPKVTVYAADQTTIKGTASGLNQYGATLSVTVPGVLAGQTYFVRVEGAEASAFGTGRYALTLNFGSGANPVVPLPDMRTPNGNPLKNGGGMSAEEEEHEHDHVDETSGAVGSPAYDPQLALAIANGRVDFVGRINTRPSPIQPLEISYTTHVVASSPRSSTNDLLGSSDRLLDETLVDTLMSSDLTPPERLAPPTVSSSEQDQEDLPTAISEDEVPTGGQTHLRDAAFAETPTWELELSEEGNNMAHGNTPAHSDGSVAAAGLVFSLALIQSHAPTLFSRQAGCGRSRRSSQPGDTR